MRVIKFLLTLSVFFIPFTSFKILPTFYRPVSIFFLIIPAIYILFLKIKKKTLPTDEALLILFLILAILQTSLMIGIIESDFIRAINGIIVPIIGVFAYLCFKKCFQFFSIDYIIKVLTVSFIVILTIGLIETLSLVGVLPQVVKQIIGLVFSGEVSTRLQLVTSEPAWASKILIFGFPFILYRYETTRDTIYKISLVIIVVLFLFTFSLVGYVSAMLICLGYLLINFKRIVAKIRTYLYLITGVLVALVGIYFVFNVFASSDSYYITRIYKMIDLQSIKSLMKYDGSTYIRIMYPLVGVYIFFLNPWGVGLDGYGLYLPEYLNKVWIGYIPHHEVVLDVTTLTGDPKSLYAKILAENGLVSGIPIIIFLGYMAVIIFKIKNKMAPKDLRLMQLNFLGAIIIPLQTGSFAYLPMWFSFALLICIYKKIK